jgi:hypothetical protein
MASYLLVGVAAVVGLILSRSSRLLAAGLIVVVGLLVLWIVPALRAHGAGWPGSFASLHGSASLCHLVLCLGSAVWAWRLSRAQPGTSL